ncbi:TetR family transcriptional regulator [Gibbsiella quercinecans]|uniref:HTH tetR-type domain-containing protein n=1 Tax=Gibbsiella quercinecans TaxID=929813 RepID=A0A250B5S5_9GAMM|nr:TetR/AcrR family transcriptional regulator [Gibbsiella quercinecans]ATA21590.1 hypothetical protein AWC35_20835 [Gibbsiella quercinecans]RLM02889.1 hypothetical protein BIY31_22740 [Gibbsiella quercinecans]RLM06206.1 hypothetical protein BIY30_16745 [Gibbsiella quercinecans]TCT88832.1 TetR family transcriptional regulator [Gibbsiella quercinecans]
MKKTPEMESTKKAAIVQGAFELFLSHGFTATTTNMIASKCMISKRDLYKYFPDKNELYIAAIASNTHKVLSIAAGENAETTLEGLLGIFHLNTEDEEEPQRHQFLTMLLKDAIEHPALYQLMYDSGVVRHREELIEWLSQQQKQGKLGIKDPEKITFLASMIMDIVFGALVPKRPGFDDLPSRKAHIIAALQVVLYGIERYADNP